MQCFSLGANYFNDYNSYTTNHLICQPKTAFDGGGGGGGVVGGVGGEERLFLGKPAGVGKLICCFVLKLEYLIFFTAVTYLPILEGDFSV